MANDLTEITKEEFQELVKGFARNQHTMLKNILENTEEEPISLSMYAEDINLLTKAVSTNCRLYKRSEANSEHYSYFKNKQGTPTIAPKKNNISKKEEATTGYL